MKFKEYIEGLQKFAQENPESLEFEVIHSKDDGGNGYEKVWSAPTIGMHNPDGNGFSDFICCDEDIEDLKEQGDEYKPNAICIN